MRLVQDRTHHVGIERLHATEAVKGWFRILHVLSERFDQC